jgi:hypothetical protein
MIRSFDWRDFGLIRRLSEHGVCFDSESALTRGPHSLQSAVLAFLAPGVGLPTFIWRGEDDDKGDAAFGQIQFRQGDENARLISLAPRYADGGPWETLLERLAAEAASKGAHNLVAEVDEHSAEFEALRQFGFAIYTRQQLWRIAWPNFAVSAGLSRLRPQHSADNVNIQSLYANIVPRLVQQVEPPPPRFGHGYVFEEAGEINAFFDVSRGPLGIWVQPYLHPNAFGLSRSLLADLFGRFTDREAVPIYVCVRSHQDWLRSPLTDLGFETWGEQAVMVKRLAVRIGEPEFKPLPALVGKNVTTPMIKFDSCKNESPTISTTSSRSSQPI